jgi:thymidylate kinase
MVEEFGELLMDKLDRVKPSAIIYFEAPIEVCLQRIHQRGNEEEEEVTLEYLQLIKQTYDRSSTIRIYRTSHPY